MRKTRGEMTDGDWTILEAVWRLEPCTAPTVQEALQEQTHWPYNTVKTMMDRMAVKGLLKTERVRHLVVFRSAISQKRAKKSEVMGAVKRAFEGALTPMMQFMLDRHDFTDQQLSELETLIREKRRRAVKKKR